MPEDIIERTVIGTCLVLLLMSCASPPPEPQKDRLEQPTGNGGAGGGNSSGGQSAGTNGGSSGAGNAGATQGQGSTGAIPPDHDAGSRPSGQPGGAFPFPQGRKTAHCTHPNVSAAQVQSTWDKWKAEAIVPAGVGNAQRVRRWEDGDDTVSEGIAYGMLGAVYMNDQPIFDGLWEYAQLHLNRNGFMHWRINASGVEIDHTGATISYEARGGATDADEDMAWALVMAHYQWGGRGSLNAPYLDLARDMINRIWRLEVDHNAGDVLKPGDLWGGASVTNPSYFAPSYYRVFGEITGQQAAWNRVVDSSYAILERAANDSTGLVPAWCNANGQSAGMDYTYQYDACRTPFRIALDYCSSGDPRAKAYLQTVGSFFKGIGAGAIKDGYELGGGVRGTNTSMAFIGPAGVGAMVGGDLSGFSEDAYTELLVLGAKQKNDGYTYYNSSWGLLSILMMSGNFLDYSSL